MRCRQTQRSATDAAVAASYVPTVASPYTEPRNNPPTPHMQKDNDILLLKGNEAIAHAAIRYGYDGFFGYPITPQDRKSVV